jgi:hypothetical protein
LSVRPWHDSCCSPPLHAFFPCAGLSLVNPRRTCDAFERSAMFKTRLFLPALAGVSLLYSSSGATLTEDFSSNPFSKGWKVSGDTNLFQWNATNHNLSVTWDSAKPNSYFYHPLGTVLARDNDFSLAFDLRVDDIGAGPDTNKLSSFPVSVGFLNLDAATATNFIRGTGADSPDLVEFAYFWDSGFGATSWPILVDTNSTFNYDSSSDYALLALSPGDTYHIAMTYHATNQTLVSTITNQTTLSGVFLTQQLTTNFTDFRLGSVSINSYSEAGQDPQYAGSVLAHGVIDNVVATFPAPPLQPLSQTYTQGTWKIQFSSATNWSYTLEHTADFQTWAAASVAVPGTGAAILLSDTNAPNSAAFYRVRATRP